MVVFRSRNLQVLLLALGAAFLTSALTPVSALLACTSCILQALEDRGLSLIGTHEGRNKAALLKPISSRGDKGSADWQDQQTENVAAHLAKAKAMVASNALDPILFGVPGSRPGTPAGSSPAPPGAISAGETDYQNYYSHRRPQLSNGTYRPSSPASHTSSRHQGDSTHHHGVSHDHQNYLVRPGSAASSSSPLASEIAQHPLRPPSQPGSAAQWMPRPGTPTESATSVITNRPTTAPTAEISSAVQSWGFALPPAAAPAATSASRPGTASGGGSGHSSMGTNRPRPQSHRDHHAANRLGSSRLSRMAKNTNGQEVKPGMLRSARALRHFLASINIACQSSRRLIASPPA